jgi:hypothetical protein
MNRKFDCRYFRIFETIEEGTFTDYVSFSDPEATYSLILFVIQKNLQNSWLSAVTKITEKTTYSSYKYTCLNPNSPLFHNIKYVYINETPYPSTNKRYLCVSTFFDEADVL